MWRSRSSDVKESSAGFNSAGKLAACAAGVGLAAGCWFVGGTVVQAHANASDAPSASAAKRRLFIVEMLPRFRRERVAHESFAAARVRCQTRGRVEAGPAGAAANYTQLHRGARELQSSTLAGA